MVEAATDDSMAHTRCMLHKQSYTPAHVPGHPHTHTPTRAHTHRQICQLFLFHGSNGLWTRLDVTLYVHCLSCSLTATILTLTSLMGYVHFYWVGRDSSVGIATRYGMDGLGIESRWGRYFRHPSRPTLGPTRSLPRGKATGVWR